MHLSNSRGQTGVEYVLLLLVVVIVLLSGFYRFNQSFENFANNYFGEYLGCLLETGELPSLGSDGSGAICDAEFQPFTLAEGRPPVEARGGSGGSASGTERNKGPGNEGSTSSADTGRGGETGGGGGGSVPVGRFDPGFRDEGTQELAPRKVPAGPNDPGGGGTATTAMGGTRSGLFGPDGGRPDRVALSQNEKLLARAPEKKIPADIADVKEDPRRVPAEQKGKKGQGADLEPWEFGDWVRILLIILIILAIVVFFGMQAASVAKSQEK